MTRQQFLDRLIAHILPRAARRARLSIPGRLKGDLQQIILGVGRGKLYLDPYYALYVHDGRPAQSREQYRNATRGGLWKPPFIWFKNPLDDPRLVNGRTPARAANLKHLTKAEFKFALAKNQLNVRWKVGPTDAQPFFSNRAGGGMNGFLAAIQPDLNEIARRHILASIGKKNLALSYTLNFRVG